MSDDDQWPRQRAQRRFNLPRHCPWPPPSLLRLYEQMVLIRRFELAAQDVYKKGEMPGFIHLYVGEEATAVGVCAHLQLRRLDHQHAPRTRPRAGQGSAPRTGHGRALRQGDRLLRRPRRQHASVRQEIRPVRHQRFRRRRNPRLGRAWRSAPARAAPIRWPSASSATERSTTAAFHESINFAGVQKAPVVFVCENNLYATATPLTMATANTDVASKAAAYGIPGVAVDGNDVLAVWEATRVAVERARKGGGPTLIEAKTYRTVGHHEGDQLVGTYRTQEELDLWKTRCPIHRFSQKLLASGRVTQRSDLTTIDEAVDRRVIESLEFSRHSPSPDPAAANDHVWAEPLHPALPGVEPGAETVVQGYLEAVRDGDCRGNAPRSAHHLHGRGNGRAWGQFCPHQGPVARIRRPPDDRHADFRAGFHRGGRRRLGQRMPGGGRLDVRRLHVRGRHRKSSSKAPSCAT